MSTPPIVHAIRRGRAPNCSATGSVVGAAILSVVAAAALVNGLADRFAAWLDGEGDDPPEPDGTERPTAPADDPTPRVRREVSGGIVAWNDPPALLFVDTQTVEAALHAGGTLVGGATAPRGALSAPTEVHVSVTDRCPVACDGCYLDAGPDRDDPDPDHLMADLVHLADLGVLEVALGGGEALVRDDVVAIADRIRALGMVPNLTTSGLGLTADRARALGQVVGQVNVSMDGPADTYRRVRGWSGHAPASQAIRNLTAAGVRVGVNTLLTRDSFDSLDALADELVALGVHEWQWLRLKPAGRATSAYHETRLTEAQASNLWPRLLELESRTGLVMRIDCALVPFVVAHAPPLAAVEQLGVAGCPGGHSLWSRRSDATWAPCSFAHDAARPAEDVATAWRDDSTLGAWRDRAEAPPAPCGDCTYRSVCRGGCRVVAGFVTGDALAADPECPRVLAHDRAA